MKQIMHLATSKDGFIATPDGDSDWVSSVDEELFRERAREVGALVVGRNTFRQYEHTIYPVSDALNIVLTSANEPVSSADNVAMAHSVKEAIEVARASGASGVLIAGGAKTAGAFLRAGEVQDIFLSVHPLVLHEGLKPFDDLSRHTRYELVGSRSLADGVEELHYHLK